MKNKGRLSATQGSDGLVMKVEGLDGRGREDDWEGNWVVFVGAGGGVGGGGEGGQMSWE